MSQDLTSVCISLAKAKLHLQKAQNAMREACVKNNKLDRPYTTISQLNERTFELLRRITTELNFLKE